MSRKTLVLIGMGVAVAACFIVPFNFQIGLSLLALSAGFAVGLNK